MNRGSIMSIDSLARQAVIQARIRQSAFAPAAGSGAPVQLPTRDDALSGIAKYIPTEVVTLFLFSLSALPTDKDKAALFTTWSYCSLIAFTPLCFWLIFAAKFRAQDPNKAWPTLRDMPWWRMFAATAGFSVWALAIPKVGLFTDYAFLWGILALSISTVFSLIERAFDPII